MPATMNLLSFPEELLERILEQVVLYPSLSHCSQCSAEAPSTNLGPSPISSPATTPKSSPSATRHASPQASPTRSRPPSPASGGSPPHSRPPPKARIGPSSGSPPHYITHGKPNAVTRVEDVKATSSSSSSSSWTSSTTPRASPNRTAAATPLDRALAPLLTCRLFSRIALPLYYRVVQLKSREQARLFLEDGLGCAEVDREGRLKGRRSRDGRRFRAKWIRRLVICGVWKEAGEVVRVLAGLVNVPQAQLPPSARGLLLKPIRKFEGKGKARAEAESVKTFVRGEEAPLSLRVLEITIDSPPLAPSPPVFPAPGIDARAPTAAQPDDDAEAVSHALKAFAACWSTQDAGGKHGVGKPEAQGHAQRQENPLRHMVLRKPQNVYLTQPRSKMVISAIANVVESAEGLESAFVAFRISDDAQAGPAVGAPGVASVHPHAFQVQHMNHQHPPTAGSHSPNDRLHAGPITQLTSALASRPRLKTFATMLPSVWNEAILRVSLNESLARVTLLGLNGIPVAPPTRSSNRYSLQLPSRPAASPLSHIPQSTSLTDIGATPTDIPTHGSPGGSRRPRLSVMLPPNPVERVYAASTRDVNGFHPTNPNSHASAMEPYHGHGHGNGGYGGGGYVPMGTGLFMNQAKKHERLCELIRSGAEPPPSSSQGKGERELLPGLVQRRSQPEASEFSRCNSTFIPTRQHSAVGFSPRFNGSSSGYPTSPARA